MLRHREFDVAEMSLSSYAVTLSRDDPPFVAIPVFPSRMFRHSCIFVSTKSGIREAEGPRRVAKSAVPEYQMTAPVWIRGILQDEYGVDPAGVDYFTGGVEEPGRDEKIKLDLPPRIRVTPIGPTQTLSQMLADGEIDALHTARAPSTFATRPARRPASVRGLRGRRARLLPADPDLSDHAHGGHPARRCTSAHPWIAQSLAKAFAEAKRLARADLGVTNAQATMLPWQVAHVEEARREMGDDWWPYGLEPNRAVLDTFLRYHHEQGLSPRRLSPDQLFVPETHDAFRL